MDTPLSNGTQPNFRGLLADSLRYWEFRRLIYNLVLLAVVAVWVAATWPHFRTMLEVHSVLLLAILALLANACYCGAYLVENPNAILSGKRFVETLALDGLAGGDAPGDSTGQLLDCRRNLSLCPLTSRNP